MKNLRLALLVSLLCIGGRVSGQTNTSFDLEAYKVFLSSHQDMSSEALLTLHSAGLFEKNALANYQSARCFQSISDKYALTQDEKTLLGEHGFVVTERIQPKSFGDAFLEIYNADLPVFVSTDAILHALHMSYDGILKSTEQTVIIPKLGDILTGMQGQLPSLADRYKNEPRMMPPLVDLDLYLTVARRLLGQSVTPYFMSNTGASDDILAKIAAAQPVEGAAPLFEDSTRLVDYSQFTPRGHYTVNETLKKYFRTMMWLGRTEFYLSAPQNTFQHYADAQIQRQTIAAVLVSEAVDLSAESTSLGEIDDILRFFVGESDNVTLSCLKGVLQDVGLSHASDLLDSLNFKSFQASLLSNGWAYQRILSQMLVSGSCIATDQIKPASAFLLMGQRFVIDSYVTGNVVYDKIVYQNEQVLRMLPSTLDVLYALGNNASGQLLVPELDAYHYATNLAALRYLIDSYEPEFWTKTIYNGWLNAIRSLNPPTERTTLPAFMQTAAWWQEKLNTQLSSWAQLRHDNLLYAKQSYSGIPICSFPYSYVEPIPEFYRKISVLADSAASYFHRSLSGVVGAEYYFQDVKKITDTLGIIAETELSGTPLNAEESSFLKRMMFMDEGGCAPYPSGWYTHLFLGASDCRTEDEVVADVHTSPGDEGGVLVGWVLHAGTGPLNMAFLVTEVPGVGSVAFVGPVMSYYGYVTSGFKRLTDEEWKADYAAALATRPSWVNLYLADAAGSARSTGANLLMGVNEPPAGDQVPQMTRLEQNYPNPFNPGTTIPFMLAHGSEVTLEIFNTLGQRVATLLRDRIPAGSYAVRFDGTGLASGVYFYRLHARPLGDGQAHQTDGGQAHAIDGGGGDFVQTRTLILLK
jgi:hypothetical protein